MKGFFWAVWLLGVGLSSVVAFQRWHSERNYRSVALVVDGREIRELEGATGHSLPYLLKILKDAGATAVSVSPFTLSEWLGANGLTVARSEAEAVIIKGSRPALLPIAASLKGQFGLQLPLNAAGHQTVLYFPGSFPFLRDYPFFLDQKLAEECRQAGLATVARLPNPPFLTERGIHFWITESVRAGATVIVFEGEEVLGFRNLIPEVNEFLKSLPCLIGIVELISQKGDQTLALGLPEKVVRVHSISGRELAVLPMDQVIDRLVRAVVERNIRLCYLRLPTSEKGSPLELWIQFLKALQQDLQRRGFQVGLPTNEPLSGQILSLPVWLCLWLSLWAGIILLKQEFLRMNTLVALMGFGLLGLLGFALKVFSSFWADRLGAFLSACVGPVFALTFGVLVLAKNGQRHRAVLVGLVSCFFLAIGWAIVEAAFLYDYRFRLKIVQFVGVKASQLLPVLAVFLLAIARWWEGLDLPAEKRLPIALSNVNSFLANSVRWGQALFTLTVLAGGAYWMMRTGNEPGLGVSPLENTLRQWLEDFFGARPRFKEFAIGYPMLTFAFYFLTGTQLERRIGHWLLVLGTVGLASLMNSFSHAHTPIAVSFLRSLYGIGLGIGLGLVLIGLAHLGSRLRDRTVGGRR
ncbi:MAG: DUF5693 family protein [Armatimonadetes bacterium]|nr:DUF5693 family protein [Armatimonadota bacterium]MDW8122154.1 DUF5693 family protein [Armatimonadota bacterium]